MWRSRRAESVNTSLPSDKRVSAEQTKKNYHMSTAASKQKTPSTCDIQSAKTASRLLCSV